jgi:hypothetical protein
VRNNWTGLGDMRIAPRLTNLAPKQSEHHPGHAL